MIVSIASGKGGTGKTTLAVNLALALGDVQLLDCDVEEPNCHLFLKPEILESEFVYIMVPEIDEESCDYCGRCAEFCQYNALAVTGGVVMKFPELCHSCGGCVLVCPRGAVTERTRIIGGINHGKIDGIDFWHGVLNIGEAMASPIIRELKQHMDESRDVLIDAPPGTSCAVIESVKDSDYCILVTEPTPFGLNDLSLAVEMLESMDVPHGVVVNRDGIGDTGVYDYCREKNIQILLKIPHNPRIAELYSNGLPFINEMNEYSVMLKEMFNGVKKVIE
jgi:MinD superfamily P-loop ATPase